MASHLWWCPLRWSDMDSYGHVNNVQFLRYLEDARVAMLFHGSGLSVGSAAPDAERSPDFEGKLVVVRHEIDYRQPLFYRPEPVLIRTQVTRLSAASVTLAYVVSDGEQSGATTYVTARSVLAGYDLSQGRARRFTETERAWLDLFRPES